MFPGEFQDEEKREGYRGRNHAADPEGETDHSHSRAIHQKRIGETKHDKSASAQDQCNCDRSADLQKPDQPVHDSQAAQHEQSSYQKQGRRFRVGQTPVLNNKRLVGTETGDTKPPGTEEEQGACDTYDPPVLFPNRLHEYSSAYSIMSSNVFDSLMQFLNTEM